MSDPKKVKEKEVVYICMIPVRFSGVGHLVAMNGETAGDILCGGKFDYTWANRPFSRKTDCKKCARKSIEVER